MRIFLTGATGFLGGPVLSQLKEHELLCLVRNPQQHISGISHGRPLVGDLAQPHTWRGELERFAPQWCVHLAWEGLPDYSLTRCRANLNASIELIEILVGAGAERIVVPGTCWEYGNGSGAVQEDGPTVDCGVFAATKHALRLVLESVARDHGIEYRWARIFFVYGPNQRATSLIPQSHAAYSQGRQPEIRRPAQIQDFIFVDDAARGVAAITSADIGSGVFNIGSGEPHTVADVVNRVGNYFGAPPLFARLEPESGFWADTKKTFAATGWKAQTLIDEGIRQTLKALDGKI